ncbi:MAG TPA: winged helix-turn-helix transcriptional regulator [Hyphomonas sp.]|nr:transcriptional regulator [Hyphomonas sp.]MCA8904589.1 transcriptional regulator [Hyphomonas sp.]MCB9972186.1 transcriptional regulator [Hyphomonas sp.]HPE49648.1 winged helix-turn-helix transcriptional regulator [Hyphomonas sp.]
MNPQSLDKKRLYHDGCSAAHAMDLIGERWALLVIRELMLGPKRFNDIRRNLQGISANVLSQRLDELERIGIVIRRTLPPPASVQVYDLTDWGRELEPVFQALGRWAVRSPFRENGPMSVNALLMSFSTMFDASRAAGFSARISMLLEGEPCHVIIADGAITAQRGTLEPADVHLSASTGDLLELVYGGKKLGSWLKKPDVSVSGKAEILSALPAFFPIPAPVES